MPVTLTVILKDSERTYRHKFLIYENFSLSYDDPMIRQCIKEAQESFGNEADDVTIRASMEIR